MDEIRSEFLDLVKQVRTHLEYQRALGLNVIDITADPTASDTPISKTVPEEPKGSPAAAHQEIKDCKKCKLSTTRVSPVFGKGNPNAVIVFIGGAPEKEDEEQGLPFTGAAGQLLTDIIVKGMKLTLEDVYVSNAVKCRPPDSRNPDTDEISACGMVLIEELQAVNPKLIVALGAVAVRALLQCGDVSSVRGTWKTWRGIPVMPTYDPAHLLENPGDKKLVWEDIKKVIAAMTRLTV